MDPLHRGGDVQMNYETLLQYGIGTAVIFGFVLPMFWKLLKSVMEHQKEIVRTQEGIAGILENHLSSILQALKAIEVRLSVVYDAVRKDSDRSTD